MSDFQYAKAHIDCAVSFFKAYRDTDSMRAPGRLQLARLSWALRHLDLAEEYIPYNPHQKDLRHWIRACEEVVRAEQDDLWVKAHPREPATNFRLVEDL